MLGLLDILFDFLVEVLHVEMVGKAIAQVIVYDVAEQDFHDQLVVSVGGDQYNREYSEPDDHAIVYWELPVVAPLIPE